MLALKIKKDDLARGVGQTSAIAEKRSSMPILSNILMEADDGELKLTATDMEISFQGSYPAEVGAAGRLTVPAKKFNEVVRLLNAEEISLQETDNFSLALSAGKFSTQMYGLSPADFPQMPEVDSTQFIDIEGPALAGVIEKTIYSVAMEETRYNLAGVYMEKVEYEGQLTLRLVSTDGHRLNMAGIAPAELANLELVKGILISKKGLTELSRMAALTDVIKLGVTNSSLIAKTATATLVMRLLDGRFPDYNMVLPKDNTKHLTAGRKELLDALKRIATMSSDDYKAVKFKMEPGLLTISSMTPELGKAEESIEVEYDNEPLEAGFNPRFFIEALSALSSEKVKLSFNASDHPAMISAAEDPGYCGVVMSMKI